jgi:hypothetical protein
MNNKNEHQHYVSRVLLKRFTTPGKPLQCYQVQAQRWKERSLNRVFAVRGWNQLLAFNQIDNSLEAELSKVESLLPATFDALADAASRDSTELSARIYENLCRYCMFLLQVSPFAKAKAVAECMTQLNSDLQRGQTDLLRKLDFPEKTISRFRDAVAQGGHLIVDSENAHQLVYRIHVRESLAST